MHPLFLYAQLAEYVKHTFVLLYAPQAENFAEQIFFYTGRPKSDTINLSMNHSGNDEFDTVEGLFFFQQHFIYGKEW